MSYSVGKRKEKRVEEVHPIRLWGMDANGRPFLEAATTLDVSTTGARLKSGRVKLSVGDVIGLKSGDQKCRFQVIWVGKAGTPDAGHLGLRSLDELKLWGIKPAGQARAESEEVIDTYARPPQSENRLLQRLKCSLSADIGSSQSAGRTRTFITDISLGGCYVSIISPLPLESKVTITVWLDKHTKSWLDGIVISRHPGLGMGIKFLNLSRRSLDELNWLLGQLADAQFGAETEEAEA